MRRAENIAVGTNFVLTQGRAVKRQIGIPPCLKPNQ
jgi:hypothetical protein